MAHFAQIDENGTVLQVIVVNNSDILDENGQESEEVGVHFCKSLFGGEWLQTSYNGTIRHRYASIGGYYDAVNNVFMTEKPFPSWSLNENFEWQAPVPMPEPCDDCLDGHPHDDCGCGAYAWDEENQQWVAIPTEEQ